MTVKKVGVALVAALALSAFAATAAHAEPGVWKVGGSALGGSASIGVEKLNVGTPLELSAPELGIKLTATGINCTECTIYNNGTAAATGKLQFTGVTVDEPEGCQVAETLSTKFLHGEVIMFEGGVYEKFAPESGGVLMTIQVFECAIAGKYSLSGATAAKSPNATGEEFVRQDLTFNGVNTAGAGMSLGGKNASLMGEIGAHLTGAYAGSAFGAE